MPTAEQNSIPHSTADKLIAAHDGDVALLYIWLDLNGGFNADRAARELCRTEAEIKNAYEKLCRMELARTAAKPEQEIKLPPAEELPEYTSADIVRRSKEDSGFQAVIAQAQHKLGRVLSTADLKTLFGIYDYLALPADVIFMLIGYCIDVFTEKYGPGRLPSMRSIEKEAYSWANKEIITIEQAAKRPLGSVETCNKRTINQFIHPSVLKTCQLSMGMTALEPGSNWNTMPSHTHERRMEIYTYFEVPEGQVVFHMCGEPTETRHIVMHNYDAVISPSWSIHSGVGTSNYTFIWAMGGENMEFDDMDNIATTDLR